MISSMELNCFWAAVKRLFSSQASRQFDMEGRKKFFTLEMNNILLEWVHSAVVFVSESLSLWCSSSHSFSPSLSVASSCRCRSSLHQCALPSTLIWRPSCRAIKRLCWSGWRSSAWTSRTTGCARRCTSSSWPSAASCRSRSHATTWTAWPKSPSENLDYIIMIEIKITTFQDWGGLKSSVFLGI